MSCRVAPKNLAVMGICNGANRWNAFAYIRMIDLKGAQHPFGKAQDRGRAANRKQGHWFRATRLSSFLPDRTLTLHSIHMTTQPTQSNHSSYTEPTWTDVSRAIFRSGRRDMPLEEYVEIFLRLFRELAMRASGAEVFSERVYGSFDELMKCGFIDSARYPSYTELVEKRKAS